jgi:hypothetical protein
MINYSMDTRFGRSEHARRLIAGYVTLLQQRVKNDGWNPYFLTFMFRQLPGNKDTQLAAMERAIVRFYSTLLTRIVRNPHSAFQQSQRPILVAAPDYPVFKHDKQKISDIAINDGLHMHAMLAVPWKSRMKEDIISHLQRYTCLYVKDPFKRINISVIEDLAGSAITLSSRLKEKDALGMTLSFYPRTEARCGRRRVLSDKWSGT